MLRDLVDPQGNLDLVLDLCEVVHLEPAAAPIIIGAARYANRHGGRLRVADRAPATEPEARSGCRGARRRGRSSTSS